MIHIRRGLDLTLPGAPEQRIAPAAPVRHVALLGDDYVGLRPRLAVQPGDHVRTGQLLFTDKRNPDVRFTSPGCGEVVAVNRGAKRKLDSVVVRVDDTEESEEFDAFTGGDLERSVVRDQLVRSGLWTALRARPFGRTPPPDSTPRSLFVTAIDTQPFAPDPTCVLAGQDADFVRGLKLLARLTDGPVRLCQRPDTAIPGADVPGVDVHEFAGPHPAGLPGTHIHFLDPAGEGRTVWHIGYQDVAAVGALFRTGRLPTERVVALAGPLVESPGLVRTRLGASTAELLAGRLRDGRCRVISGSVLAGRAAAFLGRYHRQVSVLSDVQPPEPRAILPIRVYEKVMPLDLMPVPLLKALVVGDIEHAIELGCLELDEEDLALCSYVCPGNNDFGAHLRKVLNEIEKDA